MDLATYLSEQRAAKKLTLTQMAKQLNLGVSRLHDISTGRRPAPLDVALAIEAETGGAVKAADLAAKHKQRNGQQVAA